MKEQRVLVVEKEWKDSGGNSTLTEVSYNIDTKYLQIKVIDRGITSVHTSGYMPSVVALYDVADAIKEIKEKLVEETDLYLKENKNA